MSDTTDTKNSALTFWAVIAGAVLAAVFTVAATSDAPSRLMTWALVALSILALMWGIALLSLSDAASRGFMAGTLRKSTYTQIYTTLTTRLLRPMWAKFCDEPDDPKKMGREGSSVIRLFRYALTWRLYDAALLVAVAYPILLPVVLWVTFGSAIFVGSFELLPAAPFWWPRAALVGASVIITLGVLSRRYVLAKTQNGSVRRIIAYSLVFVFTFSAATLAILGGLAVTGPNTGVLIAVVMVVGSFSIVALGEFTFILRSAFILIITCAFAVSTPIVLSNAELLGSGLVFVATMLCVFSIGFVDDLDRHSLARFFMSFFVVCAVVGTVVLFDFDTLNPSDWSVFLFLGVLPIINALFDTVSYAATLTLMRRGLRSSTPWLWGLADLAIACVLFLALGCTLVFAIHGLSLLAGVPLIDLPALFAGAVEAPTDYLWLYLMLFSTILPTLAHAGLSLLGVQGLWPRGPRQVVATWIEGAPTTPLRYLWAGLALGTVWTVPILAISAILWGLWTAGQDIVFWALGQYLNTLLWLAAIPVGAI